MDSRSIKRITIFSGHYGSGKTNVAVNYALWLKSQGGEVSIADLDIVNPYFRTKDSMKVLLENGVKLISSEYANSNVDVPALPAETYSVLHDKKQRCVIDVGGDDRGALALGRYSEGIIEDGDYELLFVINKFRPLTRNACLTLEIMAEIENACHMKFTAIVNDSNLGDETGEEDVLSSVAYANEVSEKAGIPIKMTCVKKDLYEKLSGKIENLMPIDLYVRQSWAERNE
ncbi:MAG: hypothetical protein IJD91_08270 [Clostridia bacterium]|nr:hypothetical protein [Clostridia bacterium]